MTVILARLRLFLACYSHFLAGEKLKYQVISETGYNNQCMESDNNKKDSQSSVGNKKAKKKSASVDIIASNDTYESRSRNSHLRDIYLELAPLYFGVDEDNDDDAEFLRAQGLRSGSGDPTDQRSDHQLDGFLLFMFGVVVKNLHKEDGIPHVISTSITNGRSSIRHQDDPTSARVLMPNARQILLESLRIYPWNWCAFCALPFPPCPVHMILICAGPAGWS